MKFAGFINGTTFITKKGHKGSKIDSLWVKNLFDSFVNDDEELAQIALESCLADLNEIVINGDDGAPFSIAEYAFYSENQFQNQAALLQENERKVSTNSFLSKADWELIDGRLLSISKHSSSKFRKAVRGDTFAALAIRQSAFLVTKMMIERGVDPLVENEDGEDLMVIMKQQYNFLGTELKRVQQFIVDASKVVFEPSILEEQARQEEALLDDYDKLATFADSMQAGLLGRIENIEKDRLLLRAYALKNEDPPEFNVWNAGQLDKAVQYIKDCQELRGYIEEKMAFHRLHVSRHENLSAVLRVQLDLLGDEIAPSPSQSSSTQLQFVMDSIKARSVKQKVFSEPGLEEEASLGSGQTRSSRRSRKQAQKLQALASKLSSGLSVAGSVRLPPLEAPPPSPAPQPSPLPSPAPQPSPVQLQSPAASARSSLSSSRSSLREDSPSRQPMSRQQLYRRLGLTGPGHGPRSGALFPIQELRREAEEYAPLLGTLLETDSTTVMYR
mmetsp:Transcript_1697/g.2698  ORF Transcript_1697/g.2698 Transcript_1697/m.2698 type:complete len:501 (+) Transcript_1697:17-1519(+)